MHTNRLLAGALALLIGAGIANARQLTVAEALNAAGIQTRTQAPGVAASGIPTAALTLSQDGLNTVYVVNNAEGFVVLAADDVAPAVLGYSDNGSFEPGNIPSNMQAWLDDYSAYIASAATAGTRVVAAPADPSLTDIAPLVRTRWNQGAPYYNLCPTVDGLRTYTGCVATAIAQVLKTYEHPTTGTGTNSYTWNNQTLSFDFGATTFQWDKMTDTYDSSSSPEACQAVAELMYACGIACYMNYGTGGSGANGVNLSAGLIRYLGYDASLQYISRDYFTLPVWSRMLHDELSKGHPLYYDGANGAVGHAFVIDGYRASDGFFHVNWGWGGMSDGYFSIVTLDPDAQGIGGSTEGYYLGQSAIFNLKPAEEGSELALQFIAENILPEETSAPRNDAIYLGGGANSGFYNTTLGTVEVEVGVELTAPGLEPQYAFYPETVELNYGYGFSAYPIVCEDIPTGTFTGRPVVRCEGKIVPFLIPVGQTTKFTVVSTDESVTFTPNLTEKAQLELVELKSLAPCFRGKTCFVEATVHNAGAEYYGTLNAYFLNTKGNSTTLGAGVVDILPNGDATIRVQGTLPAMTPLGTCHLRLTDDEGNIIGQDVPVTLEKVPDGTPDPSIRTVSFPGATGSGTDTDPYIVDASAVRVDADLYVGGGFFTSDIRAYIFAENASGSSLFMQAPYVACWGTETQTLNFSGDLSGSLSENVMYALVFLYRNGREYNFMENAPTPCFKTGGTSGIEQVATAAYGLFPNPALSDVTLTAPGAISGAEVFDLTGSLRQHILFGDNEGRVGMDVSQLAAGQYVVRLTTADGDVRTMRLIKK